MTEPEVPWISELVFETPSILRAVLKNRRVTREQLWLGSYFQKEILSAAAPPISIRWIDDEIGWGIFAEREFSKMEFIAEYTGIVRKRRKSDQTNAYCFEYPLVSGEETPYLIDAENQGGLSRYLNHGAKPNLLSALATVANVNHIVLYTNQSIPKGTELCYNYGPDYWKHRNPPR